MEFHGFLDSGVLYGHSSTASFQVVGTLEGEEGAIQNLYSWANANGCSGLVPDIETVESDHSIKKFTECEDGSQAVLYTLNFAQHNPYLNDYEGADGPFNEATLKGNPTGFGHHGHRLGVPAHLRQGRRRGRPDTASALTPIA